MMYVPWTCGALGQQPMSHLEANLGATLAGPAHRRADLGGDGDAGHLVVQELGVALGVKRQDAQQHGPRQAARPARRGAVHEAVPLVARVDRLGHDQVRARVDLVRESLDLMVQVVRRWIERRTRW